MSDIPGVCQKKGNTYRRFRIRLPDGRWGDRYIRLPDPTDPSFAEALARVNGAAPVRPAALPDSVGALVVEFRAALARGWTRKRRKRARADRADGHGARPLASATMRNYRRYIDRIEAEHGHRLVADLRPAHVYRIRDAMADRPGTANNYLSVLKLMLAFACERDWRADNPAADVPLLPLGEHEPWPADVLVAALAAASPMLRLAIVTGLCSGQRIGDVIRMRHNWHDGRLMQLVQHKTGKFVAIPMHPFWLAEIAALPMRAMTMLYDRAGKPFSGTDRVQERIRRLMVAIGRTDANGKALYTFHGLRKNACCYLLELGLSDTEAGAILGMSPETVQHYGKRARALMIARGAARRVSRGKLLSISGEPTGKAAKKRR